MNLIKYIKSFFSNPNNLAIWLPLALIIPNIILNITEPTGFLSKSINILLPIGFYLLLTASSRRIGLTGLLMLPFMIFAGFQIVLSYLYGESIIAVDMFLNVVTTNVSEATELLANLVIAMANIIILYVPAIIWAIYCIVRKHMITRNLQKAIARIGSLCFAIGIIILIITASTQQSYSFIRETFPINVIDNLTKAINRYKQTTLYPETSANFTYNAFSMHDPEEQETYIYIIGETSRAINWQLMGYNRETNPELSKEPNLVACTHAISESNTTHKSVPMLLSFASAENFDSIYNYKSIITAFKESGFHTAFFSNQLPNRSFTEFFGNEAHNVRYLQPHNETHPTDSELIPLITQELSDTSYRKKFIVLHTYGSHFLYRDRYPKEFAKFRPDNATDANKHHRQELINAYDNSIVYTDHIISSVIKLLKKHGGKAAVYYSADHGEDIFDDSRERFLHASPNPTYYQLHVASVFWLSDETISTDPEAFEALSRNSSKIISPQKSLFHTALDVAGIASPKFNSKYSLVSFDYTPEKPVYLTDLNQPVPLMESGLSTSDKAKFTKLIKNAK